MRRSIFAMVMVGAAAGAAASAASAKGFEHSRIHYGPDLTRRSSCRATRPSCTSPGPDEPTEVVGPQHRGNPSRPHADLGPAYTAVVSIGCERGKRSVFRETLYPSAPLGLQVFTPEGAVCASAKR